MLFFVLTLAVSAAQSRPVNILRIAHTTDPDTLDPAIANTTEDGMILYLVHRLLIDVEHGTNVVPGVAQRWEVSPDARKLTFWLRGDVTFSNGRPVVADDFCYALERIADPRIGSWQQPYLSAVRGFGDVVAGRTNRLAGVNAPAPDRLTIDLDRPDLPLLYFLAFIAWATPRAELAEPGAQPGIRPLGAGPYRLVEWRRGVRIVLERNPHDHPIPDRRFDRVELEIGGDEMTHLMRFERGELDLANLVGNGVPLSDLPRLRRNPRWAPLIETVPGMNLAYLSMNTEIPPFGDRRVRHALNHAIDRPRRMLTLLRQFETGRGLLPPSLPGHDAGTTGYGYDPDRARSLLAEAGVALPLQTVLWHPNDQRNRMVAEGIQEDLSRIGVRAELRAATFMAMLETVGRRSNRDMALFVYNAFPDPRDVIGTLFDGRNLHDSEPFNVMFYNNPAVNALIDRAASSPSNPERYKLFQQAERIVMDDAPCVILGYQNLFALRQPSIRGEVLESFGVFRLDRVWRQP